MTCPSHLVLPHVFSPKPHTVGLQTRLPSNFLSVFQANRGGSSIQVPLRKGKLQLRLKVKNLTQSKAQVQ